MFRLTNSIEIFDEIIKKPENLVQVTGNCNIYKWHSMLYYEYNYINHRELYSQDTKTNLIY